MEGASCCHHEEHHHDHTPRGRDWLLLICTAVIVACFILYLTDITVLQHWPVATTFAYSVVHFIHSVWWGIAAGILFTGLLAHVPRELVMGLLGRGGTFSGVTRAICAGVMFDLCSHGILMVSAQLYRRGASLGQMMAFLIASPWNSFSTLFILWGLIGFGWTILFLLLSLVIALISGLIFDRLVAAGVLAQNPHVGADVRGDWRAGWKQARQQWHFSVPGTIAIIKDGFRESLPIMRWLLLGIILAALLRTFVPQTLFAGYFGPTMIGLVLTLVAATVIEVCSEGSSPIAGDLLVRAAAPGNSFTFLMAGASTDYTELMVIREATGSWKTALFLPLVTVPQIVLLAWILNSF